VLSTHALVLITINVLNGIKAKPDRADQVGDGGRFVNISHYIIQTNKQIAFSRFVKMLPRLVSRSGRVSNAKVSDFSQTIIRSTPRFD